MSLSLVAALLMASCGRPAESGEDPQRQPPEPPRFDRPAMVDFHMRRQLDDLRQVERLLIAGKLDEARARAEPLTRAVPDPGMERWRREVDAVTQAAAALVAAPGIDEACRREAQVAEACAWCHLATQKVPAFAVPAVPAADGTTPAARMARHQWAVDRLWEGMVGPSEHRWRSGLEALAVTPLPFSPFTDAPLVASRMQDVAQQAIAALGKDSLDDRARRYGEMLVMCSACHATLHAGSAAPR